MKKKFIQYYERLAQATGLVCDPDRPGLYGHRGGYGMAIYPVAESAPLVLKLAVSVCREAGPLTADEVQQFRAQNVLAAGLVQQDSVLLIDLSAQAVQDPRALCTLLDGVSAFLQEARFDNCCQVCGQVGPTEACSVGGRLLHLCQRCFTEAQQREAMSPTRKENPIAGTVGALLGSLIGVACIILLSRLGFVAALSGVVMAVCALKGYELLGGRLTRKGVVIGAILALVMTYMADRIDWAIVVMQETGIDLFTGFQLIPVLLEEGFIEASGYWGNLVLLYVFLLIGMVPTMIGGLKASKNDTAPRLLGVGRTTTL